MLKQNVNNLFRETVRGLWFLWCEDLACDWLQHNKHSRHILGVHGNIISAVKVSIELDSPINLDRAFHNLRAANKKACHFLLYISTLSLCLCIVACQNKLSV